MAARRLVAEGLSAGWGAASSFMRRIALPKKWEGYASSFRRDWRKNLRVMAVVSIIFWAGYLARAGDPLVKGFFAPAEVPPVTLAEPPDWVQRYVEASCSGDVDILYPYLGGRYADYSIEEVREVYAGRDARGVRCTEVRYLGSGHYPMGDWHAYALTIVEDGASREPWYVYTTSDGKVIQID